MPHAYYVLCRLRINYWFSWYLYTHELLPCLPLHPQASKHYLAVARSMKLYEEELYGKWLEDVEACSGLRTKAFQTLIPIDPPAN